MYTRSLVTVFLCVLVASNAYPFVAGDIDNSTRVDAMDVQLVINGALSLAVPYSTDIDYSGNTDAMDVQLVINAALALDIDTDNDGLCDSAEAMLGTDSAQSDTDNDGIPDRQEVQDGTDPLIPNLPVAPAISNFAINSGAAETSSTTVSLDNACTGSPTHYMASELGDFSDATWLAYSTAPSFTLSSESGSKTVYFKVKNAVGESGVSSDTISLSSGGPNILQVLRFSANNGVNDKDLWSVTLNNQCSETPDEYLASEHEDFAGALWRPYSSSPQFQLLAGTGAYRVYFKVRKGDVESAPIHDDITISDAHYRVWPARATPYAPLNTSAPSVRKEGGFYVGVSLLGHGAGFFSCRAATLDVSGALLGASPVLPGMLAGISMEFASGGDGTVFVNSADLGSTYLTRCSHDGADIATVKFPFDMYVSIEAGPKQTLYGLAWSTSSVFCLDNTLDLAWTIGGGVLSEPYFMAVAPSGNFYVVDGEDEWVKAFVLRAADGHGQYDGMFGRWSVGMPMPIVGIAADRLEHLHVAYWVDDSDCVIRVYDLANKQVLSSVHLDAPPTSVTWAGLSVAYDGTYLLAESGTGAFAHFSEAGAFLGYSGFSLDSSLFAGPWGVAVGTNGITPVALVVDQGNAKIKQFDLTGSFIREWGSLGAADGQFQYPEGIACAGAAVFVADSGNHRIQKFDMSGTHIDSWGSYGSGDGQFNKPRGIAVGPQSGRVYVCDARNNRIQKFTQDGGFVTKWNAKGEDTGSWVCPDGIAVGVDPVSHEEVVYVADSDVGRVHKFGADGTYLSAWSCDINRRLTFSYCYGIALTPSGNVLISDTANDCIQEYTSEGVLVRQWGLLGGRPGEFWGPVGLAYTADGWLIVAENNGNRVQAFDTAWFPFSTQPTVRWLRLDYGQLTAVSKTISLANVCEGAPFEYAASEGVDSEPSVWQPYGQAPSFTLGEGVAVGGKIEHTIRFRVRNEYGMSPITVATITE